MRSDCRRNGSGRTGSDICSNVYEVVVHANDGVHDTSQALAITVSNVNESGAAKIIDGYLAGATVFADSNANGILDVGEASTTTDAAGAYVLNSGSAPIVAFGGTDIATGLPFNGIMMAPAGSTVITPLTTLLAELENQDVPNAAQNVLAAFGLDANTDLLNLDPIAATAMNDSRGSAAFLAGTQVIATLVSIASLVDGANAGQFKNAFKLAGLELASMVASTTLDLTNENQIQTLISNTSAASGCLSLDASVHDGAASVIADLNMAAKDAGGATGADLLASLSAVAKVAQGFAADALHDAGANPSDLQSVLDAYTGANLDGAINSAEMHLGDVDGPAFQNAPVAHDDNYSITVGSALHVASQQGVLADDIDVDHDPLSAVLVSGPEHGTLTLQNDGSFNYVTDCGFSGVDSFSYVASDNTATSNTAVVSIEVGEHPNRDDHHRHRHFVDHDQGKKHHDRHIHDSGVGFDDRDGHYTHSSWYNSGDGSNYHNAETDNVGHGGAAAQCNEIQLIGWNGLDSFVFNFGPEYNGVGESHALGPHHESDEIDHTELIESAVIQAVTTYHGADFHLSHVMEHAGHFATVTTSDHHAHQDHTWSI